MTKQRVISGAQATGTLHLGNYLGALRHWVNMQDQYECLFFLADLHAITIPQDPIEFRESIYNTVAAYLAAGLDPKKVSLFAQSDIKEHAELGWILNCMTPIGWLKRMTQFKDKAGKNQESASTGLFTYPVLMAADILLYKADIVPVGEDQKQHLELTRDIAEAVNRKFDKEIFRVPEPLIQGEAVRVKSLRDGTKKMSKSDGSDNGRINLSDTEDLIVSKIKKAKTDSLSYISYEPETRPEVTNLINIYAAMSVRRIEDIVSLYQGKGFAEFKNDLADLLVANLIPINKEFTRLQEDKAYLRKVLQIGKEKALPIAETTLKEVKELFGYLNL